MFCDTPVGHDHLQTSKPLEIAQVSKIKGVAVLLQMRVDHLTGTQVNLVYYTSIGYYLPSV